MTTEAMSPLRRRMIEDMTIRNFGPKTQHDYVRSVRNLTVFLGRSPDTASNEDVRRFQLHLASDGISAASMNNTVSGLRSSESIGHHDSEIVDDGYFDRDD